MCELIGAALDAAVARALDVQGLVYRPNGQPAFELLFDPEGPADEAPYDKGYSVMFVWYKPSVDRQRAMGLQEQYDIAVYPDPELAPEKWIAGFNICIDDGVVSDDTQYGATIELNDAARGPTPAIAICRALVKHLEPVRLNRVRQTAFDRANHSRQTRTPWLEFEDDEARKAYDVAMADQMRLVHVMNGGQA